jgi:signal transduction histidine kinase
MVLLGLYRFRLRQLARRMDILFGERLAERTRIAQELHDKLLQGFLSASMHLHVTVEQVPEDSPARLSLARALQLMSEAIEEDRNALRGLRSSPADSHDLDEAFSRIHRELVIEEQMDFRVAVAGRPRPLHPIIRDEVYRLGREALMNAFRHSGARTVEVELEYTARYLRLLVRDNGGGIDPQVLRTGGEGHGGLSGMRERAEKMGARLKVRSRATVGTEVELSVPSHIAFPSSESPQRRWAGWYPKRARAGTTTREQDK